MVQITLGYYDYLFKFEIQKCEILCTHKPCFLMLILLFHASYLSTCFWLMVSTGILARLWKLFHMFLQVPNDCTWLKSSS